MTKQTKTEAIAMLKKLAAQALNERVYICFRRATKMGTRFYRCYVLAEDGYPLWLDGYMATAGMFQLSQDDETRINGYGFSAEDHIVEAIEAETGVRLIATRLYEA